MSRMVRDIEVGIKGAGGKVEREIFTVPASDVDDREPQVQLRMNDKLKKRLYVNVEALLWAKISDEYDADVIAIA